MWSVVGGLSVVGGFVLRPEKCSGAQNRKRQRTETFETRTLSAKMMKYLKKPQSSNQAESEQGGGTTGGETSI